MTKLGRTNNKVTIITDAVTTGFARVVRPGTKYQSDQVEYSLQFEIDQESLAGVKTMETLMAAHEENVAYELKRLGLTELGDDCIDYGVPVKAINTDETTKNGKVLYPDTFTSGNVVMKAKSAFAPKIFGRLDNSNTSDSVLNGIIPHEIPVGSTVQVKITLVSYVQEGNKKTGAKTVIGSSPKLQAVRIIKFPEFKAFGQTEIEGEVLSFDEDGEFPGSKVSIDLVKDLDTNKPFDESIGI